MKLSCSKLLTGLALPALAVVASSCGGEERTFTPAEFVDTINAQGAGISLGPVLTANAEGDDVHTIELVQSATGTRPTQGEPFGGSGTLLALADADAAAAELERCEATATLVCFRAANVVLRFDELPPAGQARVTAAVEALATD